MKRISKASRVYVWAQNNVVYHLTDCPRFITGGGKALCIHYSCCQYAPEAKHSSPGQRNDDLDSEFLNGFPGMKAAYLQNPSTLFPQDQNFANGTLFWLPLKFLNQKSSEKRPIQQLISGDETREYLKKWMNEIKDAMLF